MPLACVLISDITGSTQLYESESNQSALEQVSLVLKRMREIIEECGGQCVKSQGDDVLSFFDQSEQAFQAAWKMLNEAWPAGLSVHVGTYFGEILNHENDIYGSAVNTAARLSSLAKPGEILVGDRSYDDLSEESKSHLLMIGEIQLRGQARATRVYSCSVAELSEQTVIFGGNKDDRARGTEIVELNLDGKIWQIEEGESLTHRALVRMRYCSQTGLGLSQTCGTLDPKRAVRVHGSQQFGELDTNGRWQRSCPAPSRHAP